MNLRINEIARLSGVSVRTLHYYHEIGLLSPAFVDEQNGYRFYDEASIARLQEILFYRELDFPLKSIAEILSAPNYNKSLALARQKQLLLLKKERLERLLDALDSAAKGETVMNFSAFDNSDYEAKRDEYAKEAKETWGDTAAYQEHAKKTAGYTKEQWNQVNAAMDALLEEIAACHADGVAPAAEDAQALVRKWQDFITANFYTCTKQILAGLGQMYLADERFKDNMNRHGAGTTEFFAEAIRIFCA